MQEQDRINWDKFLAGADVFAQILLLSFASLGGILRVLIARLISFRLSDR